MDTLPAIEGTRLSFPERGLELLCDCVGQEFIWEAQYLRPYIKMATNSNGDVGGPLIPILLDKKPIDDFLTLKQGMKVALLICDDVGSRCAGLGVIDECSPRGVWCGFLVPHSFFVIVTVTTVNTDYADQTAYCEDSKVHKLGAAINHRILWSGYKVRPTEPLIPPPDNIVKSECIGGPPIPLQPQVEDADAAGSDGISSESKDDQRDRVEGGETGVEESEQECPTESNINPN